MSATRLVIPIAVLALTLAGCGGGSKVVVQEVPGGSVEITVNGGEALAPRASATPTVDASATATPEAATAGGTAPAQQTQPQQSTAQQPAPTQAAPQTSANGGATAPEATPPPGASKQQFETFCQQNPGAC